MLFNDYLLFKGTAGWWLMKNESSVMAASELKVVKCGLKAFQKIGHFVKPTTRMIQIFGHTASRARFEIEATELSRLIAGEEIPVNTDLDTGYVILGLRGDIILGLGFLIHGKIRSQLPLKQIRQAMVETL
jgi:NOL1/NOP2/fmu family ribosome biogenesis protein